MGHRRRAPRPGGRLLGLLVLGLMVAPALAAGSLGAGTARAASGRIPIPTDAVSLAPRSVEEALPPTATITLEAVLAPSNLSALQSFTAAVVDPSSPSYHRFLTERAFEARFEPPATEPAAVSAYFAQYGGRVIGQTPDRLGLSERLTVGAADRALGVRSVGFREPDGGAGVTALGTATVPAALRPDLLGIDGISDLGAPGAPALRAALPSPRPVGHGPADVVVNASSGEWWYTGSDYAQAYQEARLFPEGTPSVANATFANDTAVATILMSGYNQTTDENLAPFDPAAVAAYFNDTFPANWPRPTVSGLPYGLDGVVPPLPATAGTLGDSSGNVAENSIDLEMAGSLAPGASLVNFYFAASLFQNAPSTPTGYSDIADDFAEGLALALNHSYGAARLAAVSNSYGLPDLSDSLWSSELVHAAATGVTVVAASGDQGDAPDALSGYFQGPGPTWPGSAAANTSGTIAVGGLTVNLSAIPAGSYADGVLSDPFDTSVTGFTEQTGWYDTLGPNLSGSEGGASLVAPEPGWQRASAAQPAIVNATVAEGLEVLGRAEPDVAFPANATIAYLGIVGGTLDFDVFQGTSISAPIFAGMLAEISAVAGHPFGFLDPELYRIGSYYAANPGPTDPFEDVTTGQNYLYHAGPGWDPLTGWGTIDPVRFLAADADPAVSGYNYTGPSPGLPPPAPKSTAPSVTLLGELVVLVLVVGVLLAVAIAFVLGGTRRSPKIAVLPPGTYAPTPGGPPPPFGRSAGPGGPPPTFLCPYCGSVRPAEPVRCPACGAF